MPLDLMDGVDADELNASFAEALDFSVVVSVTLPGQSVEHNADLASSGCDATTFKWDVDISDPPDLLYAEADGADDCEGDSGWGSGPIAAVVILGVMAAAVAAALVVRRFRRDRAEPDAQVPDSEGSGSPAPVDKQ